MSFSAYGPEEARKTGQTWLGQTMGASYLDMATYSREGMIFTEARRSRSLVLVRNLARQKVRAALPNIALGGSLVVTWHVSAGSNLCRY